MPSLPITLLGGLAVLLLVALVALFVGDRLASRKVNDGSEVFKGWDELSETDVARRIGTRAEVAAKRARNRRRQAAIDAGERTTAFEPVPEPTAEDEEDQTGFHYYPVTGPSRFRVWRDAAAVLLVVCLAVLAVAVYLPNLTNGPAATDPPSQIANASHTPPPSHTPRPSGSEEPSAFPTAVAVAPDAPTGLTAAVSADGVALSWVAPLGDGGSLVAGFQIYRSSSTGAETLLSTVGLESSYTDSDVSPGATYFYYVRAVNAIGPGTPSDEVSGTIPATGPGRPGTLFASASGTSITLSWSKPSNTGGSAITGYIVYRGTSSGGEGLIARLGLVTGFLDTGRSPGVTYFYVVRAVNSAGAGFRSNEASASIAAVGPGVPLSLSASSSAGSVALTWSAPSYNGGSSIVRYLVLRSTTSGSNYSQIGTVTCSCSAPVHYTDSTVSAGSVYYYVVKTVTGAGTSGSSNQATGLTVPGAPGSLSATGGVGTVTVTWSAPAAGGSSITSYNVLRSDSGSSGTFVVVASPTTPGYTDSGLGAGVTEYYEVQAVNGIGGGPVAGPVSNGAATTPGAPTIGTATPGNASASVTFSAPSSDGGSSILSYTATSSPGGLTGTCASSPCTVSGLTNGLAYTFTVTATNAVGAGSASGSSNSVTPRTVPGAPTIGTATAGNASATLTFSAPASNGGSSITGYTASWSGGSQACAGSPCNITGLTNGVSYSFTVAATNVAGTGPSSGSSNSVTPSAPATAPGAPNAGTIDNSQAGQLSITWSAPGSNGGSAILGYRVYRDGTQIGGDLGSSAVSYTDTTTTAAQSYTYTVTAFNAVGEGSPSGGLMATAQ